MKIIYHNINEAYFKPIGQMKQEYEKRKSMQDDDYADLAIVHADEELLRRSEDAIRKFLFDTFANPRWWITESLGDHTNLRPGFTDIADFNVYLYSITDKSPKEQAEYLNDKIPYDIKCADGIFEITVLLRTVENPINSISISSNGLFSYIDKKEQELISILNHPAKLKFKIEPVKTNRSFGKEKIISSIIIGRAVNFKRLVTFIKDRIVYFDIGTNYSDKLDLTILNRVSFEDMQDLYELGNYVKFYKVNLKVTKSYATRLSAHTDAETGENKLLSYAANTMPLDGINNLLKPVNDGIYISEEYGKFSTGRLKEEIDKNNIKIINED